jgi:hypothetical protein
MALVIARQQPSYGVAAQATSGRSAPLPANETPT